MRLLAINPDPAESDRRVAQADAIRRLGGGATPIPFASPDDVLRAAERALAGTEIGWPLLWAALAALLAELVLANWIAFWRKRR